MTVFDGKFEELSLKFRMENEEFRKVVGFVGFLAFLNEKLGQLLEAR